MVQLLVAHDVSGKVATDLASQPGCTRKLVQTAMKDMPREARNPPGMLVTKIKQLLQTEEAKEKESKRKSPRPKIQKEESKPPTEEETADILDQINEFKEKIRRGE